MVNQLHLYGNSNNPPAPQPPFATGTRPIQPMPPSPMQAATQPSMPMTAKQRIVEPTTGMLTPLTQSERDGLSPEMKNKSDDLMVQTLRKCANASYLQGATPADRYTNYLATIKNIFMSDLGTEDRFKLQGPLLTLIGPKNVFGGSFQQFADAHLKINRPENDFLNDMYSHFDYFSGAATSVVDELFNKIQTCFFWPKTLFTERALFYSGIISANIVDAQRTVPSNLSPSLRDQSDNQAVQVLKEINNKAEKDMDPRTRQIISTAQDYIILLCHHLNRLRVDPKFYKFNEMSRLLDLLACVERKDVPNEQKIVHCSSLNATMLESYLESLFFNPRNLDNAISNDVLVAIIAHHAKLMAQD